MIDSDRKKKGRFILTGSNSPDIVKGMTESLAGRIATVEMWPFKRCEYYETGLPDIFELLTDGKTKPNDFLQLCASQHLDQTMHIWFKGGFPEPLIESENNPDSLLIHQVAEFSFESFVIEEVIRGLQATMATQMEFNYYRTIDKSEVDLVIDGSFGLIPIEIKLNSTVNKTALRGLKNFLADTKINYGLLINRGKRIELLTDKIIQIPVNYI